MERFRCWGFFALNNVLDVSKVSIVIIPKHFERKPYEDDDTGVYFSLALSLFNLEMVVHQKA